MTHRYDVALVHAPSIYDFRKLPFVHYGPISDGIPSKPIFDMYPVGFFSLASYLEKRGVKTGIYNIAARMVNEPSLDVPRLLKQIRAEIYGLDLHWLVHAHGTLELARMLKEIHEAPIVVGGLSATYYWKELLSKYSFIDVVVLGDTTEPVFYELVQALEKGDRNRLREIPNIAYRDGDKIRYTGIKYVPLELDDLKPDYGMVLKVMVRSGLHNSLPWSTFLKHPITAVITYKGCACNCLGCGGSNFAYKILFHRKGFGVKSPKILFEEYKEITERLKAPIFFVNDLQFLGRKFLEDFTQLIKQDKADVELFFEFFNPPSRDILELYRQMGDRVYLQLSPESHDEKVRETYGRLYSNASLKSFVKSATELGFTRLDLYFMVGLPLQTPENVRGLGGFYEELHELGGNSIDAFVAPLAPFIDPGSLAFHFSRRYGYRILGYTLEEHRKLLLAEKWFNMLNYETNWMSRSEIAEATYNAVESLVRAKFATGVIDQEYYNYLIESINNARRGQPRYGLDSKETLKEEELYPVKSMSYLTPRLIMEILRYKIGL